MISISQTINSQHCLVCGNKYSGKLCKKCSERYEIVVETRPNPEFTGNRPLIRVMPSWIWNRKQQVTTTKNQPKNIHCRVSLEKTVNRVGVLVYFTIKSILGDLNGKKKNK